MTHSSAGHSGCPPQSPTLATAPGTPPVSLTTEGLNRPRALGLLVAAMAGWGTIGVFALHAEAGPVATAAWRCVFASVALSLMCLATGAWRRSTFTRHAIMLTLAGGVALVANWVCLFTAFERTTITIATVAYHMEPFFLVALAALVARRAPGRMELGCLATAFAGLALATQFLTTDGFALTGGSADGVFAALLAGLLYAAATFAAQRTTGLHPQVMTLMQCLLGAAILLPFAGNLDWHSSGWHWIAVMGVVHTGILYWLLYAAARALSTTTLAAVSFVNPAVAILSDILIYRHTPTPLQLLGIAVVTVATTTLVAAESRHT